ncbi:hypothetical protein NVP1177O_10 [Vibrio phage 1.177.O._10N.286.45.E10]|nr:hypothetical protein NVP1177O_10 [Vibrio phage 1.177.O._10N.286.45.E10]
MEKQTKESFNTKLAGVSSLSIVEVSNSDHLINRYFDNSTGQVVAVSVTYKSTGGVEYYSIT